MTHPKRIFIINGHPGQTSLSRHFAETYADAARQAGHDIRLTHLHDIQFDPDFEFGSYENWKPLEPQLESVLGNLEWAEHIVVATPMWWGSLPAKLKGLIDRAFLPGRTFDTRNTTAIGLPRPLLAGRTARVIVTSDTPGWFFRLAHGNAMLRQIRHQIFGLVGIKPTRTTHLSGASHPKPGQIDRWMQKVAALGQQAA